MTPVRSLVMDRRFARKLAVAAAGAGMAVAFTVPTAAFASPGLGTTDTPDTAVDANSVDAASPEMLAAMQRDLGLTADQARARLAQDDLASRMVEKLSKQLDADFGGAWLSDTQQLMVGITDPSHAPSLRDLGVQPTLVTYSQAELDAVKGQLDAVDRPDHQQVTGWYVDITDNTVVVLATPGAEAAAAEFIESSGVDSDAVVVEVSEESPQLLYDVRGGDAYYPGNSRCSIGFSVNGGFVTAGHCGGVGTTTRGSNQVSQGTVRGSSFPGNDYGWVQVNSNWTPRPWVNNYSGGTVTVAGSQEAAVGASVCRSGSTTGWRCGTIQAKNQTVNYAQGSVYGLTRTNACAEGGDSGGSWLTGQQAQGVTSGGSGNCSYGGTTYFQPVNEILQAYGLTLVTGSGGGGPDPDPDPPGTNCSTYNNVFSWYLSYSGARDYEPNGSYWYESDSGTHQGCLNGPSNADFDLYLQKYNGASWVTVASSLSPSSNETITYNGTPGYYRYMVYSYSGSGNYTVGINAP